MSTLTAPISVITTFYDEQEHYEGTSLKYYVETPGLYRSTATGSGLDLWYKAEDLFTRYATGDYQQSVTDLGDTIDSEGQAIDAHGIYEGLGILADYLREIGSEDLAQCLVLRGHWRLYLELIEG